MKLCTGNQSGRRVRTILTGLVLLSCWTGREAWGQTNINTAKVSDSGKRYLLIVETSRAMERCSQGVQEAVERVLGSTLSPELAKGDTVGTWTYNDALNSGRFPLQEWSPVGKQHTIAAITRFLAGEKYEKKPRFDKVMPALASVVANSPVLTVILITSGAEEIRGTPFDEKINTTLSQWREEQQKSRLPFVVLLRAQHGKMAACAVTPAPWPLEVPPLPELRRTAVAQTNSALPSAKPTGPVRVLPPLIVSGKKPQPAQTNLVSRVAPAKVEVPATASPPATPTVAESRQSNAPITTASAGPGTAVQSEGRPAAPAAPTPPPPKPTTHPVTNPVPATVVSKAAPENRPAVEPSLPVGPTPRAPATNIAATVGEQAAAVVARESTDSASSTETVSPAPGSPVVAATPPPQGNRNRALLLGGTAFLVLAIGLFWWNRSRARAHRPISLITRSLNRPE